MVMGCWESNGVAKYSTNANLQDCFTIVQCFINSLTVLIALSALTTMVACTGECKVDSQVLTILLKEIRYKVSASITSNVSWHAMLTECRCKSLNCTISIKGRYQPNNKEFSGDVQYH